MCSFLLSQHWDPSFRKQAGRFLAGLNLSVRLCWMHVCLIHGSSHPWVSLSRTPLLWQTKTGLLMLILKATPTVVYLQCVRDFLLLTTGETKTCWSLSGARALHRSFDLSIPSTLIKEAVFIQLSQTQVTSFLLESSMVPASPCASVMAHLYVLSPSRS